MTAGEIRADVSGLAVHELAELGRMLDGLMLDERRSMPARGAVASLRGSVERLRAEWQAAASRDWLLACGIVPPEETAGAAEPGRLRDDSGPS